MLPKTIQLSFPLLIFASALVAPASQAQNIPAMGHTEALAMTALPATSQTYMAVHSPAFLDSDQIPFENTQYRGNLFPGLQWTPGPAGTRSYLVIVQSAIGQSGGKSSIHMTLFNIPAEVNRLESGMTVPPAGALYGPNVHGLNQAYAGPHTHNFNLETYHFEIFALDTVLPDTPDQSFEAIEAAAKGHVLAIGDLTGQATMDPDSPEAAKLKSNRKP